MYNQAVKEGFLDNIMIQAATSQLDFQTVQVFKTILMSELVKVNMEEITTLPSTTGNSVYDDNLRLLKLYDFYKVPDIAKGTAYQYMRAIRGLIVRINKSLTDMDTLDITEYLRFYKSSNSKIKSPVTMNNERLYLSSFFSWMRKRRFVQYNPVEGTDQEVVIQKPVDYLTREEFEKLRSGCRTLRDRALLEFLKSTGVRVGECTIAERNNINWNNGDIIVYAPKTKSYRTVFMDVPTRVHLEQYLNSRTDSNPSIFVWDKAPYGTLKNSGVRTVLKIIANNSGIKKRIYPHLFRHTFGTWLADSGVDQGIIADLMGHQDTRTTRKHYIAKNPALMRAAHSRMSNSMM